MEDWQNGGFGLYIHWPFCQSKCPYCDFNSHVAASIDQSAWERAYLSEIERVSRETSGRVLNTVFFGGGTPSLMDPELVNAILGKVRDCWRLANDVEITLEANPTSVEAGRFQGYRDAGVNRVSMGIQSLHDEDLRRLGRLHSVSEAQKAFEIARNTFDRVSFDLIYARQGQTKDAWRKELREALSMAVDHLSLYQLTIEQGTAFGDRYNRGQLRNLPTDDDAADMYFITQEECEKAGMPAYEVSNHAQKGSESHHNLIYWRYGDYAGIGPGAHARLTFGGQKYAIDTPLSPQLWLASVEQNGHGENPREALSGYDQAVEYLMMGLRITEGVEIERLSALLGQEFSIESNYLIDDGFVKKEKGRLSVSEKGRPLLNAIIRDLIPDA
ncbi:radical SAM family heme chaperone HemW [Celeribacter persicus]|jgi:putative oxygen-independent coproporphyrinogen III oxidase|uniref:Heme chaperone HemW n=1 Tax=Celeribacter persicus TaxID=1651082 RepID=A0A2T5HDS6_9RHOB|nr:radical SAM family heme chaperone HemW [Celeribacter persicus]PTQ69697.1 oxygen-independent coproporphyrinogen-3 oxidase [Celeribacter persicus]